MMTETNAKPIEPTCSMCPSYPRIRAELDRLTAALAGKEADCERLEREKVKKQPPDLTAGEFNRGE